MASCCLGASNIKVTKLSLGHSRAGSFKRQNASSARVGWRQPQFSGMAVTGVLKKLPRVAISPVVETESPFAGTMKPLAETEKPIAKSETAIEKVNGVEEKMSSDLTSQKGPIDAETSDSISGPIANMSMIKSLLNDICDTDGVVETEVKFCGLRLYVMRKTTENCETPALSAPAYAATPPPHVAPVINGTNVDVPGTNGVVSTSLVTFKKTSNSSGDIESYLNRASADGLTLLQSPRVGVFRRCRTIKGKRAPPSCTEKQMVKEGQVLCFIEQLGCEIPVESDVSGEIIKILREDGEPVGYTDALISIRPSV